MQTVDMFRYIDDRPADGEFRIHRAVFADPALLELEQRYIFDRTWGFLGLESQLPEKHDFITGYLGKSPVLVTRDEHGRLHAFANVCRHKGALLHSEEQGHAKMHVCAYHGWTFDSSGRNVHVKHVKSGLYPEAFQSQDHDLAPIARLSSYRGFIFGCLSDDAPSLEDFLGDARLFIDLIVDQGPKGVELVPGRTVYTYRGNWKLQLDNGVDPYHLSTAHASFIEVQARRKQGQGNVEARSFDWSRRNEMPAGAFNFEHGHSVVWLDQPEPEKRPVYPALAEIRSRIGELKAEWILKGRNLGVFPNMQIADAISPMLRTFRPLAVDLTEVRAYCLAPVGEPRDRRAWRLRQYEDFFNPGGMATPDDAVIYEDCQRGFASQPIDYLQGCSRGMGVVIDGPGEAGRALGLHAQTSAQGRYDMFTEIAFHGPYREWSRLMKLGLEQEGATS